MKIMTKDETKIDTSSCKNCPKSGKTALECCAKNWGIVEKPASC